MFIVSGVNVFPSDVEFVVRGIDDLNGEYRIVAYTKDRLTRFDIEAERRSTERPDDDLSTEVSERVKQRCGVRPANVRILADGTLPRTTHKAKRLVDERDTEWRQEPVELP